MLIDLLLNVSSFSKNIEKVDFKNLIENNMANSQFQQQCVVCKSTIIKQTELELITRFD